MAKLKTVPTTRTKNKKGDDLRRNSYLKVIAPYEKFKGYWGRPLKRAPWRNTV